MIKSGQIVLFKFPQTDQLDAKLRPALLIGRLPGQFADWLICVKLGTLLINRTKRKVESDDLKTEESICRAKPG